MKTTFKKINPRNKLGVSTHSRYDYKSINYNYNSYQKLQHSREDYKIPAPPEQTNIICYICKKKGHFSVKTKGKKIFVRTYSKGQTYFFAFVYDIVLDESFKYVITDKSKFINFNQNFEPGNHFVDRSQANNIVPKRSNACLYLCHRDGHM